MCRTSVERTRKGFTLVELAVVIVIIGVLAAFGVPQFLKSVERSKAAESFNYLSAVRASQERFLAKNGIYYNGTVEADGAYPVNVQGDALDIVQNLPKYFDIGIITEDHATAGLPVWSCTLTRKAGSSSYGEYTVTFTQNGYDADVTSPAIGAYPEINPMGADVVAQGS